MAFVKASSETGQVPFFGSFYGPPGSGKSFTSLLFAEQLAARRKGRIAVIDTEGGFKFLDKAAPRKVHPEAFDFDIVRTTSLAKILEELRALDTKVHTCIIIDSMSQLWDSAREAYEAQNPGRDIPLRDWGKLKKPYRDIIKWLLASPCDKIINGRQKSTFEEDDTGKLKNSGVAMRAEGETQFEPDFCFRMEPDGKRGGEITYSMYVEKDRSGILAGKWFENPTGAILKPVFPFLGETPQATEDSEERADADAELLLADDAKVEKKQAKSSDFITNFQAKITAATDMIQLGAVGAEINKAKRGITAEAVEAVRLLYTTRAAALTTQV